MVEIKMLGGFGISRGGVSISGEGSRARKQWQLLAYLAYSAPRAVSREELIAQLWPGEENAAGSLKTAVYRLRTALEPLGKDFGRQFIISSDGGYSLGADIPFRSDAGDFEVLCREAMEDNGTGRLGKLLEAARVYGGDFLYRLPGEAWTLPVAAYYHNLYITVVAEALERLLWEGDHDRAAELAPRLLKMEPYREDFCRGYMRALLALGRHREAAGAYEELSRGLREDFGARPGEEARELYREALGGANADMLSPEQLRIQLREDGAGEGCMICEYEFFRALYHARARAVARSGEAVHILLLSLKPAQGAELGARSRDRTMDNLQEVIRLGLRRGDTAARCSPGQFLVMLPRAGYEDSCMVCRRLLRDFARKHPHSPARVEFDIWPIEPSI